MLLLIYISRMLFVLHYLYDHRDIAERIGGNKSEAGVDGHYKHCYLSTSDLMPNRPKALSNTSSFLCVVAAYALF